MTFTSIVLKTLSDSRTLAIFNNIAASSNLTTDFLVAHLGLTPKEFYWRISKLKKNGLIVKKIGKYSLTAFGRIVNKSQDLIGAALESYWKLNAIDSLEGSHAIPLFEYNKIVENLINDQNLRRVLLFSLDNNSEYGTQLDVEGRVIKANTTSLGRFDTIRDTTLTNATVIER